MELEISLCGSNIAQVGLTETHLSVLSTVCVLSTYHSPPGSFIPRPAVSFPARQFIPRPAVHSPPGSVIPRPAVFG